MFHRYVAGFRGFLAALALLPGVAQADGAEALRMMRAADDHEAVITAFAMNVRDNKDQGVLDALDPATIAGASSEQILGMLKEEVFPFFARFARLNGYEGVTKAPVPDGRVGLWHYTFIEDSDGKTKPFRIAIIESSGTLKVAAIEVGKCVKKRHPRMGPCK
jgi:hypothetical protein